MSDASSSSSTASPKPRADQSNVKETLESILVAFILAFIFRAFVVEAFVIPTGSMAPTLLGANTRWRCNDCGWRFTANYSAQTVNGDLLIRDTTDISSTVVCPNCGYPFPTLDNTQPDNSKTNHPVHYGDRILVLKYLYLFREPQRWDVVVFKSPDRDPGAPDNVPPSYTQNYIKRLIGRPGESVMVLDGDIYVGKAGDPPTEYQIQTKPYYAQSALWRVVYDNDFHPINVERPDGSIWKQPWTVKTGNGWNLGDNAKDGRIFRFDSGSDESLLSFDRDANPKTNSFLDWLAYDADYPWRYNVVHDLKLSCFYQRNSGEGAFRVTLGDGTRKFAAVLTPLSAQLVEVTPSGDKPLGTPVSLKAGHDPVQVELANVDYQVTLRINGSEIARTTPEQYHPDIKALLDSYHGDKLHPWPTAEISAAKQSCAVSHVGLYRDIYYINRVGSYMNDFVGTPDKPADMGEDEYFVMGDNSPISGDARYWNVPIHLPADRLEVRAHRVPARFMLGRAFFVYWPAGFQPAPMMPALAPNFGEMRLIR